MKTVTFHCPSCEQKFEAPSTMAGQKIVCETCGKTVTIQRKQRIPEALIVLWVLAAMYLGGWLLARNNLMDMAFNKGSTLLVLVVYEAMTLYCLITLVWLFVRWVLLKTVPVWAPKWPYYLTGLRRLVVIIVSLTLPGWWAWSALQ